jgi:fructokinase
MRIGVDLGGTKIEGLILSDAGEIVEKVRINTPADKYDNTLKALCDLVENLQSFDTVLLPVGIGTPGTLSMSAEIMKNCNSINLNGRSLKKDIENALGYQIRMENDANCFALSEAHYGAGKDSHTVFGVIIGTGTGAGIVINRKLLTGPNRIAGEWGHNCVPASVRELFNSDRNCYCGRKNCIETVLSARGLRQTFLENFGGEGEAVAISELAQRGEQAAIDCIQLYSRQLAQCLATIVNVIDPDIIVLGGGLSNIKEIYNSVLVQMQDFVFTDTILTKLSAPSFGDASGARGAACLWPPRGMI